LRQADLLPLVDWPLNGLSCGLFAFSFSMWKQVVELTHGFAEVVRAQNAPISRFSSTDMGENIVRLWHKTLTLCDSVLWAET
jgi:hypothetical protein